jgi:hypothetical protein
MTRFADELRGSEGERCIVTDLRTGLRHNGVIRAWSDDEKKATVEYDNRRIVRVGYSFVELLGKDKP